MVKYCENHNGHEGITERAAHRGRERKINSANHFEARLNSELDAHPVRYAVAQILTVCQAFTVKPGVFQAAVGTTLPALPCWSSHSSGRSASTWSATTNSLDQDVFQTLIFIDGWRLNMWEKLFLFFVVFFFLPKKGGLFEKIPGSVSHWPCTSPTTAGTAAGTAGTRRSSKKKKKPGRDSTITKLVW